MNTIRQQGLVFFVHNGVKRVSDFFNSEDLAIEWCIANDIDIWGAE